MPRLRYRGPEPYVITMGCAFDAAVWIDAARLPEGVYARLATNPTFEAEETPPSPSWGGSAEGRGGACPITTDGGDDPTCPALTAGAVCPSPGGEGG